ncbi:MAG: biotin/lipoyl-containing protein [Candidatus Hodarchaeales archaeon]|jgi:biotin carboxyl carrier protein
MTAGGTKKVEFFLDDGEDKHEVRVLKNGEGSFTIKVGEEEHVVRGQLVANDTLFLNFNGQTYKCLLVKEGDLRYVYINGHAFKLQRIEKAAMLSGEVIEEENVIQSPMPGKVLKVLVREGDTVSKGQHLLILEAMKMENIIEAPIGGRIMKIYHQEGEQVMQGVTLVEIEPIDKDNGKN